jgi:hypothetical protein
VNQPYVPQAGLVRRAQVLIDHGWDVPWRERVEVERVFDGDSVGIHVQQA